MADNVLGVLFQSIADAIRNKTGDTGKIVPADFPNEINSIVVGTGGGGGGTETGLGDLKIANGSFSAGTGYRKTITHGLGKMPDLVVVWYAESGNADEGAQHAAKMVLSFSMGLHSSMAEVTSYKGYYHHFGFMGLNYSKYIDDPSSATNGNIYCPDDNTFTIGKVDDGSNTTGNGLLAASGIYNWLAISGMGGSIGMVDDRIKNVTFMNGDEVLFTRPVYIGDDCPDPITQGRIPTPTKESTVSTVYTYNCWGNVAGGAYADALKNITADRKVRAVYTESVREYTVTYLDTDGTVLKTEKLPYGAMPSYLPVKEGVSFTKWTPETGVTGDMTYTAVWNEKVSFATSSWEDIARVCDAGQAQDNFALGDTRDIEYKGKTVTLMIIGFDHDEIANSGGKKAGISVYSTTPFDTGTNISGAARYVYDSLPTDLKSVIKPVLKQCDDGLGSVYNSSYQTWPASYTELGLNLSSSFTSKMNVLGTKYAHKLPAVTTGSHWLRNLYYMSSTDKRHTAYGGSFAYYVGGGSYTNNTHAGFCI